MNNKLNPLCSKFVTWFKALASTNHPSKSHPVSVVSRWCTPAFLNSSIVESFLYRQITNYLLCRCGFTMFHHLCLNHLFPLLRRNHKPRPLPPQHLQKHRCLWHQQSLRRRSHGRSHRCFGWALAGRGGGWGRYKDGTSLIDGYWWYFASTKGIFWFFDDWVWFWWNDLMQMFFFLSRTRSLKSSYFSIGRMYSRLRPD